MIDQALLKLQIELQMSPAERSAYTRALTTPRRVEKGEVLLRAGDGNESSIILLEGIAAKARYLVSGRTQIVSFVTPGDVCFLDSALQIDYSIVTLAAGMVAHLPHAALRDLITAHSRLGYAFWRQSLSEAAISREWLVNVGARAAEQRIAHLICELYSRLDAVGLVTNGEFGFPLTQQNLADATGLSVVHVNRMLQRLKRRGLLSINAHSMKIFNWPELAEAGDFDADYLNSRASTAAEQNARIAIPSHWKFNRSL